MSCVGRRVFAVGRRSSVRATRRLRFAVGGLAALIVALVSVGCQRPQIGVVDTQRILEESVLALSLQKQLNDREKLMAADLAVAAQRLDRRALEEQRLLYLRELEQMRADFEERLNRRLREVVQEVAREERIRVVLAKGPSVYGGRDLTNRVIERLK
ncbi:MAG: OmpH family outer membrane protein [Armatimonadota bacterium]|nr:OmpH family outer membrane protein [Armatimonadota bacterium]MDR5697512.1 OmpH family outer membrane protein [Armatimonadota bacterium]